MADSSETAAAAARPTKPDEALFKGQLDKLEKEHKDVMNRYVGSLSPLLFSFSNGLVNFPQAAAWGCPRDCLRTLCISYTYPNPDLN